MINQFSLCFPVRNPTQSRGERERDTQSRRYYTTEGEPSPSSSGRLPPIDLFKRVVKKKGGKKTSGPVAAELLLLQRRRRWGRRRKKKKKKRTKRKEDPTAHGDTNRKRMEIIGSRREE